MKTGLLTKLRVLLSVTAGATLLAAAGAASAYTITAPNPASDIPSGSPDPICWGVGTGNDPDFMTGCGLGSLTQIFKQDAGGGESGSLAPNYKATFSNGPDGSLANALVVWEGGNFLDCTIDCYVMIKDGDADPGRYLYNLKGLWNGTDDLIMTGFWVNPAKGAISHVAFYGGVTDCPRGDPKCTPTRIPEPQILALLGLGLALGGLTLRRRRAN